MTLAAIRLAVVTLGLFWLSVVRLWLVSVRLRLVTVSGWSGRLMSVTASGVLRLEGGAGVGVSGGCVGCFGAGAGGS